MDAFASVTADSSLGIMTSKTVKCASCNVVINELLAFLSNVLDYMDEESIHRLVTSSFDVEGIAKAKSLLFDSLPNAKKVPLRRKEGKKRMSRDLDDIICLLKGTSSDLFPIFVAKDLHLVPSVGFDHIDCTRLLKDITRLQNQVSTLQEQVITIDMFETLKQEVEHMKHASIIENRPSLIYVNAKRGACLQDSYEFNSGPVGLQYVPIKSTIETAAQVNSHSTPTGSPTASNNASSVSVHPQQLSKIEHRRHVEAPTRVPTSSSERGSETSFMGDGAVDRRGTAHLSTRVEAEESTVVSNTPVDSSCAPAATDDTSILISKETERPAESIVSIGQCDLNQTSVRNCRVVKNCALIPNENNEWQIVKNKNAKRYKLIGQKGRASTSSDGKFKAADVKVPLFISNVSKETCEQDIVSYVKEKTGESVSLKMIKIKPARKYNAFKLFVSKAKLDLFLNNELWPDGITFRRFVHFKYEIKQDNRNVKVN